MAPVIIAQVIGKLSVLGSSLDRHCPWLDLLSILAGPWQARLHAGPEVRPAFCCQDDDLHRGFPIFLQNYLDQEAWRYRA